MDQKQFDQSHLFELNFIFSICIEVPPYQWFIKVGKPSSVHKVIGTCSRDETVEAAKVAEQIDDKPINTDTWTDGETATIR